VNERAHEHGGLNEMDSTRERSQTAAPTRPLLEGRVAIITGASRGIGATAARLFADAGAAVVLAARGQEALATVVSDIQTSGGRATAVRADVSDPDDVERLVGSTLDAFGHLDVAFNNAGGSAMPVPIADQTPEEFAHVVDVNLRGTFLSMKFEIPAMLESGGGSIVNMSSTAGVDAWQGIGAYVAAKHGVVGLTKTAALDYADRGVRVNVLAPGSIVTDRIGALSEEQRAPIREAVPMHRIGLPEEVAAAAAWLCSDRASFITGAVLPVDGGQLARV
jgi:NAD(P)-dependent dehydrogenase (short-subunit alcohol dehydrogenase family)